MSKIGRFSVLALLVAGTLGAGEWKSFKFTYKVANEMRQNTVSIPQYGDDYKPPIRGVMQNVRGPLQEFAHRNQVALIGRMDQGRGFSKELLAAIAKETGRPEVEFAGAIVQGISKGGRDAADWASANQKRAIAVILDHTAIHRVDYPKRVKGVPMFFNATYADLFQKIDRRKSHHWWCTMAYKAKQPCTSIIDHAKKGGHGGRGSTNLTAVWLEEAMMHRVPYNIPIGEEYELVDVEAKKCGGYVSVNLDMDGARSYHNNVNVKTSSGSANWWIPGPKSAAMYLDWTKRNGGVVKTDQSDELRGVPLFINPKGDLAQVKSAFRRPALAKALTILQTSKKIDPTLAKTLGILITREVEDFLEPVAALEAAGDVYGVFAAFEKKNRLYVGISSYDEKRKYYKKLFSTEEAKAEMKLGRSFYLMIEKINRAKKVSAIGLRPLKSFAERNPKSKYSPIAQQIYDILLKDPNQRKSARQCVLDHG